MSRNVKRRKKMAASWEKLRAILMAMALIVTTTLSTNNLTYAYETEPIEGFTVVNDDVGIEFYVGDQKIDQLLMLAGQTTKIRAEVSFNYSYMPDDDEGNDEFELPVTYHFGTDTKNLAVKPADDSKGELTDGPGEEIIYTYDVSEEQTNKPEILTYDFSIKAKSTFDKATLTLKADINNSYFSDTMPTATLEVSAYDTLPDEDRGSETGVDTAATPNKASAQPKTDSAASKAAAAEVTKLIETIVDGGKVKGISDDLVEKVKDAIISGKEVSIEVVAPKVDENAVQADAEKIKATIGDSSKVLAYYNVNVNLLIGNEFAGTVTKLGDKVTITLNLPKDLPAIPDGYRRQFKVVRVHGGVATELDTTVSDTSFSFDSDEFSTYALTYTDVKEGTSTDALTDTDVKEETSTDDAANGKSSTSNPKTGDASMISWIGFLIVSMLCAIASMKSIKNRVNN